MKKLLIYILLTVTLTISMGQLAMAAETDGDLESVGYERPIIPQPQYLPGPSEGQQESSKNVFGEKVLPRLAVMMTGFVGGMALVFLVIAGLRFAVSYGNDESIENAKKQAIFSIIGLLLALLAYAIVTILTNVEFVDDTTNRPEIEQPE